MSLGPSLLIAFLAGFAGLLVAGLIAIACVDWYRVSNFEGASGFFVIGIALLGGLISCVLGLVVARTTGGGEAAGFGKALAVAIGTVAGIGGVTALLAYALADRSDSTTNAVRWDVASESAQNEAEEQASFDALSSEAAISEWLPYTAPWQCEKRRTQAIAHIVDRPDHVYELKKLMLHSDKEIAGNAIRFVGDSLSPTPASLDAIRAVAVDLIQRIRVVNELPIDKDPGFEEAGEVAYRFAVWIGAVKSLRQNGSEDFVPELQEILELSRIRTESITMQSNVRRVASHYLRLWAGIESLPGDIP
jgi:hypothetical protein